MRGISGTAFEQRAVTLSGLQAELRLARSTRESTPDNARDLTRPAGDPASQMSRRGHAKTRRPTAGADRQGARVGKPDRTPPRDQSRRSPPVSDASHGVIQPPMVNRAEPPISPHMPKYEGITIGGGTRATASVLFGLASIAGTRTLAQLLRGEEKTDAPRRDRGRA